MIAISKVGDGVDGVGEDADQNDDDCWNDDGYNDEGVGRDFLVEGVGEGDVGVGEEEGRRLGEILANRRPAMAISLSECKF